MKTGAQIYCVSKIIEKDFEAGMQLMARAGFDGMEVYHLYDGIKAIDYRKAINAAGAVCCGSHNSLTRLRNDLDEVMEYNYALGSDTVISHWLNPDERDTEDKMFAFTDYLNEMGVILRKNGFKLLYHNHDFEYGESFNGKTLMEIILERTDPLLVGVELHVAQLPRFGIDPVEYVYKLGQRLKYLHVDFVDFNGKCELEMCEKVMAAGIELGVEWAVFEHVYPADVGEETLMEDARRLKRMACAV